ncbi:uncharacterized protein LOC135351468 [Halichondria panicea]|uniref:uncharacterized protein LOC135351468 n=1 Tax=Halichondria panicea TaxID=6063 RepID=UPI00312B753A
MDEAKVFSEVLQPVLKEILLCISAEGGHLSLTPEVCQELLQAQAPGPVVEELFQAQAPGPVVEPPPVFEGGLCVLGGYPQRPFYRRLSLSLAYWMVTGTCPVADLPVMYMLNEGSTVSQRQEKLEAVDCKVVGCHSLWEMWSEDERYCTIEIILKELDLRGVLDLLGVRCTVGSVPLLPPSQPSLLSSFNSLHHPSARLSVGGRALSKHSHRDTSDTWWGVCTGGEEDKNRHALMVALKILKTATWINIHTLPHDVRVIEVRTMEGYGVRWKHDGSEFRGFLEPQMTDGHTVGWRH